MNLVPVEPGDLAIGKPLPWTIYDQNQNPLMSEGAIINTDKQLESLLACKPLHELALNRDLPNMEPALSEQPGIGSETGSFQIVGTESGSFKVVGTETGALQVNESGLKFQDLNLKVGDRLQLEPPRQLGVDRCIVKVVGFLENVSLLVTTPSENGVYLSFLEGENVVIRGFSRRCAFGFSSTIQKICKLPFSYLHLSFPDEVQGTILRKSPRVKTRIITSITSTDAADASPLTGTIINMSSSGVQLAARKFLGKVGEKIRLSFRVILHNTDAYLAVCGIIRRVFADEGKKEDGSQVGYGIEFCDLQASDKIILQSLIYQQMIESPQSVV